jgi:hypothetical protein
MRKLVLGMNFFVMIWILENLLKLTKLDLEDEILYSILFLETSLIIFETWCFLKTILSMKRYHRYEYELNKKSMILQFVISLVACGIEMLRRYELYDVSDLQEDGLLLQFYNALVEGLSLPLILWCSILIFVKSDKDIL